MFWCLKVQQLGSCSKNNSLKSKSFYSEQVGGGGFIHIAIYSQGRRNKKINEPKKTQTCLPRIQPLKLYQKIGFRAEPRTWKIRLKKPSKRGKEKLTCEGYKCKKEPQSLAPTLLVIVDQPMNTQKWSFHLLLLPHHWTPLIHI